MFEFKKPVTFNVVSMREYLPVEQRIGLFALDRWQNGEWVPFASGASYSFCRLTGTRLVR